jgi:hypothetical protein
MDGDHARIRELREELENRESAGNTTGASSQPAKPDEAGQANSPVPVKSDSDQAQANLEHMLESGEENPIS